MREITERNCGTCANYHGVWAGHCRLTGKEHRMHEQRNCIGWADRSKTPSEQARQLAMEYLAGRPMLGTNGDAATSSGVIENALEAATWDGKELEKR